ncbi:MAG: nicotinamide-nucleotide amidohydrolase family protein [Bacteroidetes bacterium]|nr:nicotinamide-nucleotide amidohydrolase family protein [Bacteroidota bacterium]
MYRTANPFIKTMVEKKLTLALAESVTCGLAAHKLSTAKGTVEMFKGGIVCYHPQLKKDLLNISQKMQDKYSCESPEVTQALTKNLSKLIKADIHASITGLASAGVNETKEKPVGTVFISVKYKGIIYNTRKLFKGTPLQIREKACFALYDFILSKI